MQISLLIPSPGTPGEGRVRAGLVIQMALAMGPMPSPQPSPGVPGEGESQEEKGAP